MGVVRIDTVSQQVARGAVRSGSVRSTRATVRFVHLALVVVALLVIVGTPAAAPPAWRTYEDERYGWQLRYPPRFRLERIEIDSRYSYRGASVANFRAAVGDHPLTRLQLPRQGVVVRFWTSNGPPALVFASADRENRLPLSLASFERTPWVGGARVLRRLEAGGVVFGATVWIGPRVSARDRADVARIVASFRPRALEEGWLEPDRRALVLEREHTYPVVSARRYAPAAPQPGSARPAPFYLIRAPRGFYALSAGETVAAGPTRCTVRFDRRRFEFFCPNGDRWDRLGRVIRYKDSRRRWAERLKAHLATVAYDGHVLVWPGSGAGPRRRAWPSW